MKLGNQLRWVIRLSALFTAVALQAQNPQMYFGDATSLGVFCTRFDPSASPVFTKVFESSPGHAAVQNVSFVVTNQSPKSITGLAFKYRILDGNANEMIYTLKTHSYL